MKRQIMHCLLSLISAASLSACEPDAIAPLPSPVAPDNTRIFTSSLTVASDTAEAGLVAVVGMEEAVPGFGDLRIVHRETDTETLVQTTAKGSFSATLNGRPGDSLELHYVNEEGAESEAITVVIPIYAPAKDTAPDGPPMQPATSGPPSPDTPNVYQQKEQAECRDEPECLDGGGNTPPRSESVDAMMSIEAWVEGGRLYLSGGAGFASPNSMIILSNLATSEVTEGQADSQGALDIHIAAKSGDKVALFAHDPAQHNLTSPAVLINTP